MKAKDPKTGLWKYFVDKCLPFGSSIGCAHFQRFSDALKHLIEYRTQSPGQVTHYLDDFLFVTLMILRCNFMIQQFLTLCKEIGVSVSMDKTEWGSTIIVFLGILLDGNSLTLSIPLEKRVKAIQMLKLMCNKKKATVKDLQTICGYLNFLCKAILPGCTFTQRMYIKFTGIVKFGTHMNHQKAFKASAYQSPQINQK